MNRMNMERMLPFTKWAMLGVFTLISASAVAGEVNFSGLVADQSIIFWLLCSGLVLQLLLITVVAGAIRNIAESRTLWFNDEDKKEDNASGGTGAAVAVLALFGFSLMGLDAVAQDATTPEFTAMSESTFWWLITANSFLFFILMGMLVALRKLLRTAVGEPATEESSVFSLDQLNQKLTAVVPIEMEHEVKLDHEYDGIEELDNRLPPWWVWGFNLSIVFAVIYLFNYHILGTSPLSAEEYEIAMAEAAEEVAAYRALMANNVDETNVEALTGEASLANGADIFKTHCQTCHAADGGGMAGPNLTDQYWKHGGGIKEIFSTIKYGAPATAMVSWQAQLSPSQMQEVASYILTLQGTTPANPKEPEGDLWIPETPSIDSPVDTATSVPDSLVTDTMPKGQLGMVSHADE